MEEQREECQALQSIYMEQFRLLSEPEAERIAFEIDIPQHHLLLSVALTLSYPQDLPQLTLLQRPGTASDRRVDCAGLVKALLKEAEDMRGSAMIFNLIGLIDEKADTFSSTRKPDAPTLVEEKRETPIEARTFDSGSPVTREAFIKWHTAFLTERDRDHASSQVGKLTGRQLFEQKLVNEQADYSSLPLPEDEDTGDLRHVENRSLFVDLDDLDIDSAEE